jgi:hypothetical protein
VATGSDFAKLTRVLKDDVPTVEPTLQQLGGQGMWRWLTPWRCRVIFMLLLLWGAWGHVNYLRYDCPLDLAGDEAQYWDWSRQLEISYYSKGPLVAYIIRASTAIFGNTMPAVRYPALLLAIGTAICSYWLIVKLFASDRLALGAALLSHCVPVFIAGSILMTIDPPFFFCWALATCFAAKIFFDRSKWAWIALGAILGIGFLAKYGMFLWLVGFAFFFLWDRDSRRWLRTIWPWVMIAIALAFTTPVVIWNARHGWSSLYHVQHQTGTGFAINNPFEYLGGQVAILGLPIAIIMTASVFYVFGKSAKADPHQRALRYLVAIGLSIFAIVFADSFRSKVQPNWPAPAYFTLMILSAYFLSLRLGQRAHWKWWWRGNLIAAAVGAMIMMPLVHDMSALYPYLPTIDKVMSKLGRKKPMTARQIDPTAKLRGWQELGQRVGLEIRTLGPDAFLMGEDYQTTAELAFYSPHQPKTYYASSYFDVSPGRLCQYDMWPDRSLDPKNTTLLGKDAIYVGYMRKQLAAAFDSVEAQPDEVIMRRGFEVQRFIIWRCRGFKGLTRPTTGTMY